MLQDVAWISSLGKKNNNSLILLGDDNTVNTPTLKIVFAGTPEFTLPCLDALYHSQHQLIALYTQPDRPAGRGRQLQASAVKSWGLQHDLPVYQPLHFKDPQTVADLAALKPDVMIVIAYGLILPQSVLNIPRYGCINVHASLLPRWRGASPIQQAILHGDQESGVTIMQMDAGMDTGPVYTQVVYSIKPTDTAQSLHQELAALSPEPLLKTLEQIACHQAHAKAQPTEGITYAQKIHKTAAAIDWHQSAQTIDQLIRGSVPWPIAYTKSHDHVLRIHQAHVSTTNEPHTLDHSLQKLPPTPGTILAIEKTGLYVATGHETLCITRLQWPGGKVLSVSDWFHTTHRQCHVGDLLQ